MDKSEEQRHVQDEFFQAFDEMWGPIVHEMAPVTLPEEIAVLEKKRITNALEANEGNRTRTADQLGIGRTNLIAKLKKYSLLNFQEAS